MAVPLLHTPPQTAELTFTLLTAKGAAQPGPVEVTVPLTLRAGCADSPAVLLTLRAHVVLPDITTSTSTLDFGTVCNAHCKVAGARGERAGGPLELGCVTSSAYAAQKSEPVAQLPSPLPVHPARCTLCSCTIPTECMRSGASSVPPSTPQSCATGTASWRSPQRACWSRGRVPMSASHSRRWCAGAHGTRLERLQLQLQLLQLQLDCSPAGLHASCASCCM